MKKRIIVALVVVITAACLLGIFAIRNVREPSFMEKILASLDDKWTPQRETIVQSRTFPNAEGETITLYVCYTRYFTDEIVDTDGVEKALDEIIDPETAESGRACTVSGCEAMRYQKDGRTYLRWTYSPEYSFVIDYNPEVVTEADINRMAESVRDCIPE